MSHTHYPINQAKESQPHEKMILRNVASAKYGGDWHSIPHSHSYTELFYIVGGDGQFQINDSIFPVQAHQLVVVNPNILHTEVSYDAHPLEYIVLGIDGLELTMSQTQAARYRILDDRGGSDILSCLRHILQPRPCLWLQIFLFLENSSQVQ